MISLQEMLVLMGIATTPSIGDVPTIKPDVLIKQQEEISCMADNIYFEGTKPRDCWLECGCICNTKSCKR